MMYRFRWVIFGSVALVFSWIGLRSYQYFFDHNVPALSIIGIDDSAPIAGIFNAAYLQIKKANFLHGLMGNHLLIIIGLSLREHEHPFYHSK